MPCPAGSAFLHSARPLGHPHPDTTGGICFDPGAAEPQVRSFGDLTGAGLGRSLFLRVGWRLPLRLVMLAALTALLPLSASAAPEADRSQSLLQKLSDNLFVMTVLAAPRSLAAEQSPGVPAWLMAHVGEGDGEIAQPVLLRARALYLQKLSEGAVRNPCYFAMDATRPNAPNAGGSGGRFYVICESNRSFRATSAGHGSGRELEGVADFSNGRACAKNFGNAIDSNLTAGGSYVTGATTTSFKGYYRISVNQIAPFQRTFIQFNGDGETANARRRAIGGHAAEALKGVCLLREPSSPMQTATATSRLESWSTIRGAAATDAPAGRHQMPHSLFRW